MVTFLGSAFWLFFLLFFIVVFFAFFVPGDLVLTKLRLSPFQRLILGIIIGMVLWGWQGFIFGYLQARWLSYLYLVVSFLCWFKINLRKFSLRLKDFDPILAIIITIGVLIQLSTVWFTGVLYDNGLYFCCGNLFDSILHIALTNQLVKQFPPYEPGMFGVTVQNYHYWGNLVVAELIRVFRLPLIYTQSQYFGLFISLFLGLSAIAFSQLAKLGRVFSLWLVFFLYLGGDLIFLLLLVLGKGLNFSMSSLEDGSKFLVNPPRAFSIIIFFAGISLLILWLKKRDLYTGFLMAIVLGSLVGFKVYTGFFALSGLAVLGGYYLLKKNFRMILPLILTLIVSLVIYFPVNTKAGGLYFIGLWRFEDFIVQPTLGLVRLELARRAFLGYYNWLKVVQYEFVFFFLYVVSIFGSKLIGLLQTKKTLSLLPRDLNIFLMSGIIVSAILGFFFQQKTGSGANTFNFLVSIFIIGSIYTALACYWWMGKMKNILKFIFVLLLVLLTSPRVFHEGYLNVRNIRVGEGFVIGNKELEALKYLKEKTEEKSLVSVDYRKFGIDAESPYVSFLADRPMFLSGMGDELTAHGIDFSARKEEVDTVFRSSDVFGVGRVLFKNKIDYLYMGSSDNLIATQSAYFLKTVFQNKEVKILNFSPTLAKEYFKKYNLYLDEKNL